MNYIPSKKLLLSLYLFWIVIPVSLQLIISNFLKTPIFQYHSFLQYQSLLLWIMISPYSYLINPQNDPVQTILSTIVYIILNIIEIIPIIAGGIVLIAAFKYRKQIALAGLFLGVLSILVLYWAEFIYQSSDISGLGGAIIGFINVYYLTILIALLASWAPFIFRITGLKKVVLLSIIFGISSNLLFGILWEYLLKVHP